MSQTYKITRYYEGSHAKVWARVMKRGLTLEDAQAHCSSPEASSKTATSASAKRVTKKMGHWYDGWSKE